MFKMCTKLHATFFPKAYLFISPAVKVINALQIAITTNMAAGSTFMIDTHKVRLLTAI